MTNRYSDSGVVTTKLGGLRIMRARSALGVSPVLDRDADVGCVEAELGGDLGDLAQRPFQVLRDVDGQRLQRRHVHDTRDALDRLARVVREIQAVDADEEPGERLARAGRRRDQRVGARGDVRPRVALRRSGAVGEAAPEPRADRGMEPVDVGGTPSTSWRTPASGRVTWVVAMA